MQHPHRLVRALLLLLALSAAALPAAPALAEPPLATAERFFSILGARDRDALFRLLDGDVTTVLPFMMSGDTASAAARAFDGRAETMGCFGNALARIGTARFEDTRLVAGEDGRTVFAEARGAMRLADGSESRNRYVRRLEIEDGRIAGITAYFNPVTAAGAFGRPLGRQAD